MSYKINPFTSTIDNAGVENLSASTDNAIARFNGTSGQEVQNSTVTVADNGNVSSDGELTLKRGTTGQLNVWEELIESGSSGVYSFTGMTINVDPTKYDIPAFDGHIYDAGAQTYTEINYPGSAGNSPATANGVTYVFIDFTGTINIQTTEPTPQQRRDKVYLGRVVTLTATVVQIQNEPVVTRSVSNALYDLAKAIRLFNVSGNQISANGANLNLNKSAGVLYAIGANFTTNNKNPDQVTVASAAPASFAYLTQVAGSTEPTTTSVVPAFYDVGGVKTAIGGGSNTSTIQRIYLFPSGNIRIAYGQATYASLADAIQAIQTEAFVDNPSIPGNGLLIALLVVTKGATALNNTSQARIFAASRFGEASVGAAGVALSTLQNAYDNSVNPEILTDSTRGAVTVRRGSAADTDFIFEGQNNAGTTNFSVTGNGVIQTQSVTASRALVSDASKNVISSTTTDTEIGYVSGVTSAIQTQLNGKEPTITTLPISKGGTNSSTALNNNRVMQSSAGAIVEAAAITASRALISDANGIPTHSATTATELGFVSGVTSAIQTQLNGKINQNNSYLIQNLGITATVAANALTIGITAADGTALSASNKAIIGFRNATIATGEFSLVDITSNISTVISSGSTAGQLSGVASYIYVYLINNAGTAEVAWSRTLYEDSTIITTIAEGGAGAADSASSIYSTTARSNVPIRLVGRLLNTQATAGTWATNPAVISVIPFSTETVAMFYSTNAGQSIPNNTDTTIIFEDRVFDTHNAYNTSTGVYTVPVAGKYLISSVYLFNDSTDWAIGEFAGLRIRIDGTTDRATNLFYTQAAAASSFRAGPGFVTCVLNLTPNQTIQIIAIQNSGNARALTTTSEYNVVSIARIGDL